MIVLLILISALVVLALRYVAKLVLWANRAARISFNIPGPKPLPILGNALYFLNIKDLEDGMQKMLNIYNTYCLPPHKIIKLWLGPKLIVALGNPQHIETVLSSEDAVEKDSIYRYLEFFFSGMFVLNGEKWAELRKPVTPFLAKKVLENNMEMFHKKALRLLTVIDQNVEDDKMFNIRDYIARYTEDVFFMHNFGIDRKEMENDEGTETIDHMFERCMDGIFKGMVILPYCLSTTYTKMSSLGRNTVELAKVTWKIMYEMTQERKLNKKLGEVDASNALFADLLLEKGKKYQLSPLELGKLGSDFLIGGSHSLGIMTSAIVLQLAMHPEHQDAVYKEQLEVIGEDPEAIPTWEQLSKMSYLTRVFKEVIRHFTAPLIVRKVKKDIDLGEFTLPEGSSALIILYSLHRDPTIWSHPEEFYPDHFLPEESAKRPRFSYLPFSWGPRNCPGGLYAITLCKLLTSILVRKYYFKTDLKYEDLTLKFSLFVDIAQGYMVRKLPRSKLKNGTK